MANRPSVRTRVGSALAGATRVAVGVLWLTEGITKYRAGFGGADIQLVVDSTTGNARVPELYQAFTSEVLGPLSDLFGFVMPLLETVLGILLILGALTLSAASASIATLMMYWLADQLTGQYPLMVLLSALILLVPAATTRYSSTRFLRVRPRRPSARRVGGTRETTSNPSHRRGSERYAHRPYRRASA